eukprot:6229019-Amphidinium_carterae.1
MEEIFLDLEVITMTTKAMDLMVLPMLRCTAGAIYARRHAYQHKNASGVAAVGKESCIPSV